MAFLIYIYLNSTVLILFIIFYYLLLSFIIFYYIYIIIFLLLLGIIIISACSLYRIQYRDWKKEIFGTCWLTFYWVIDCHFPSIRVATKHDNLATVGVVHAFFISNLDRCHDFGLARASAAYVRLRENNLFSTEALQSRVAESTCDAFSSEIIAMIIWLSSTRFLLSTRLAITLPSILSGDRCGRRIIGRAVLCSICVRDSRYWNKLSDRWKPLIAESTNRDLVEEIYICRYTWHFPYSRIWLLLVLSPTPSDYCWYYPQTAR